MTLKEIITKVADGPLKTEEIAKCYDTLREPFKIYGNVKELLKEYPKESFSQPNRSFDGRPTGFHVFKKDYGYIIIEPKPEEIHRIEYWHKANRAHELLCHIRLKQIEYSKSSNDHSINQEIKTHITQLIEDIHNLDIKEPNTIIPIEDIYLIVNNCYREFANINDRFRTTVIKEILEIEESYYSRISIYTPKELVVEIDSYITTYKNKYDQGLNPKMNWFGRTDITKEEKINRALFESKSNILYLRKLKQAISDKKEVNSHDKKPKIKENNRSKGRPKNEMSLLTFFKNDTERKKKFIAFLQEITFIDESNTFCYPGKIRDLAVILKVLIDLRDQEDRPIVKTTTSRKDMSRMILREIKRINDPYETLKKGFSPYDPQRVDSTEPTYVDFLEELKKKII